MVLLLTGLQANTGFDIMDNSLKRHALKQPLVPIIGYVSDLISEEEDKKKRGKLKIILRNAEKLVKLIDEELK